MARGHGTKAAGAEGLGLIGGALCLDLANTVEGREGQAARDWIRDADDLVRWGERAGALTPRQVRAALAGGPEGADRALAEALALREAIYRVFTAVARGQAPSVASLAMVQRSYAEGMRHARLVASQPGEVTGGYTFRWEVGAAGAIDVLRWRVSASAVELLRAGRLDRLRQCPGGGVGPCNWLFIDTTRGGNRRWCSMADCGGRAKWTRQNARRRGRAS